VKCPLLQRYLIQGEDNALEALDNCLQEECAWWYRENECCSMLTLAQGSTYIHKALLDIANRQC